MTNIQDHTRKKDNTDTYVNLQELDKEARLARSIEKGKIPKKMSSSKITKRVILTVLVILIIMFLILSVITGVLLYNYLAMSREMSHHETLEQHFLQDISALNKTIGTLEQHFLQDISAINKSIETYCRMCPSGWEPIGLFCYYFSKQNVTWEYARDDCIQKGSGLLLLKTKEETDVLKASLENNRYWIGLRRDTAPNSWTWLDGSMLSFSNWERGEPNNLYNNENCTESRNGLWNDRPCTTPQKYACKKGCCC